MISCAEASGDLYAGALVSRLRALEPSVEVFGFGGSRVAAARQLGISERTLRYRLASFREAGLAVAGGRR